jgi:Ion channel
MAEGRYEKGFIVSWLGCASCWLKRTLPMGQLARFLPTLSHSPVAIEVYVVCGFVIVFVVSVAVCLLYDCVAAVRWLAYPLEGLIYLFAALRVLEIMVRATDVDPKNVVSPVRTLTLAAINYVELMLCFGLVYALNYQSLHGAGQPATSFYFSIITQLTIGYGDVYATDWLRIIAAAQGLIGALFVIVVLGRAVSAPTTSNSAPK